MLCNHALDYEAIKSDVIGSIEEIVTQDHQQGPQYVE